MCLLHGVADNYDICVYFQDIEVGKAVRPQLAMRVADATAAWKKVLGQRRLNYLDHIF